MKFPATVICTGIKESKGVFEETKKAFSSTTFHLIVDVAENSAGRSIGTVSRPFKLGDATEFDKWANFKTKWPPSGLSVDVVLEVVAAADNKTSLTLHEIRPSATQKAV